MAEAGFEPDTSVQLSIFKFISKSIANPMNETNDEQQKSFSKIYQKGIEPKMMKMM